MTDGLTLAVEGGIALLTLARPAKLNALDDALLAALSAAADRIDADPSVRAAILTGEGKAFCAGGDIKAWGALSPLDMSQAWIRSGHRCFDKLARLKVPLIAALNGATLGGGMELAATADFRVADPAARFGLPETGIGMVPGWSGTQRLVRRIGSQAVRRMALGGEILGADEAFALGIVDAVSPAGDSLGLARQWAERILSRSPLATTVTKQLINAAEAEDATAALDILAVGFVAGSADAAEGVASFREKRPARFEGR